MGAIPFVGGTYEVASANVDSQECINLYVEVNESQRGKTPEALIGTPGLQLFAAFGGQYGVRGNGLYTTRFGLADRLFVVYGNTFNELTAFGTIIQRGSILTSDGPVCLADNGRFLVIVDGLHGYFYDLATGIFSQITDLDFPGADRVQFLDTVLLFNRPGTAQFFWIDLAGLVTVNFDALDFASVDGFPDRLVSILVSQREIWLYGATTTERWMNVGDALNPFQRIQGAFSEQGIAAAQSVAAIGEAHCWLSANQEGAGMVFLTLGGQTRRISTHAVEGAIQDYARIDDALGWGEQRKGHEFYWLTFPSANATWVYDLTTGYWHKRAWLNPATGHLDRHRANAHTYAFGEHYVGDWENGNVYLLRESAYSDNGNPIRAVRRAPYVYAGKSAANLPWVFHHTLQIDCETGVGLSSGQGSDPQLMLRWSDDNGGTWRGERTASLGRIGAKTARVVFRRLGRSRARIYEVSITDPVKRAILGAYLEEEVATV